MKSSVAMPYGVQVREVFAERDISESRPLVLLNGIGAGVANWGNFLEALDRPCVAIDVAETESCGNSPSMHDFSDAVINTVDSLGYKQVDLLGLSWGGMLAQEVSLQHSNRIGKLALVATLPGWSSVPAPFDVFRTLMSTDRSSEAFIGQASNIYGGDIRVNPDLLAASGILRKVNQESYYRQARAALNWGSSLFRLMRIQNPTLVMAGDDDPIAHPLNSWLMASFIPNSELHIVPKDEGGGHLFLHTRPEASALVINNFLLPCHSK